MKKEEEEEKQKLQFNETHQNFISNEIIVIQRKR